jgi:hypothetical protein
MCCLSLGASLRRRSRHRPHAICSSHPGKESLLSFSGRVQSRVADAPAAGVQEDSVVFHSQSRSARGRSWPKGSVSVKC